MFSAFQTADRVGCVFVGVIGEHDAVGIGREQVFETIVICDRIVAKFLFHFIERVFSAVAYGHEFHAFIVFTVIDHRFSAIDPQHSDFNLFHFPFLRFLFDERDYYNRSEGGLQWKIPVWIWKKVCSGLTKPIVGGIMEA